MTLMVKSGEQRESGRMQGCGVEEIDIRGERRKGKGDQCTRGIDIVYARPKHRVTIQQGRQASSPHPLWALQ